MDYGVYSTALRLFDTARDISELHLDENVVTRENLYNTYGTLFRNSSRSQEAVDLFKQAIQATERAVELNLMKADDSSASICYMHIACAELQLNHFEHSESWHRKAVAIREASPRSKPLELAMVYLNTDGVYGSARNSMKLHAPLRRHCISCRVLERHVVAGVTAGIVLFRLIVPYNEGQFYADARCHSRSSWVLTALGNVRDERNRLDDAYNMHNAAFKIQVEVWGDAHVNTGVLCHKLGVHYFRRKEYFEAK